MWFFLSSRRRDTRCALVTGVQTCALPICLESIADLSDPVGDVIGTIERPNGMTLRRVRIPIGVIGIIYESRPNVTADAAALCMKAGNAVIRSDERRVGKECVSTCSSRWSPYN